VSPKIPKAPITILNEIQTGKDICAITMDRVHPWQFAIFERPDYNFLFPFRLLVAGKKEAWQAYEAIRFSISSRLNSLNREIHYNSSFHLAKARLESNLRSPIKNVCWKDFPPTLRTNLYGVETSSVLSGDQGGFLFLRVERTQSSFYYTSGREIGLFTLEEILQAWPVEEGYLEKIG